jgi:hypothetical protein
MEQNKQRLDDFLKGFFNDIITTYQYKDYYINAIIGLLVIRDKSIITDINIYTGSINFLNDILSKLKRGTDQFNIINTIKTTIIQVKNAAATAEAAEALILLGSQTQPPTSGGRPRKKPTKPSAKKSTTPPSTKKPTTPSAKKK